MDTLTDTERIHNGYIMDTERIQNGYIEDITRWREDMNFMFSWQVKNLTNITHTDDNSEIVCFLGH